MTDMLVTDADLNTGVGPLVRRFHDNGDGTFSEQNYGSGVGADATNSTQAVSDKPANGPAYSGNFYQTPSTAVVAATVKASAGSILSFLATNTNAAARYLQIHNTTSVPAGAAVPLRSFLIPAGTATAPGQLQIDRQYLASLLYCNTGITYAFSTTRSTYTAATAADHTLDLNYL